MSGDVDFDTKIVDEAHSMPRTSFDAVRFQGTSSAFDGKYEVRGRFGVDIIDPPTTSKPGEQVSTREGLQLQPGISRATESPSEDGIDKGKFHLDRRWQAFANASKDIIQTKNSRTQGGPTTMMKLSRIPMQILNDRYPERGNETRLRI